MNCDPHVDPGFPRTVILTKDTLESQRSLSVGRTEPQAEEVMFSVELSRLQLTSSCPTKQPVAFQARYRVSLIPPFRFQIAAHIRCRTKICRGRACVFLVCNSFLFGTPGYQVFEHVRITESTKQIRAGCAKYAGQLTFEKAIFHCCVEKKKIVGSQNKCPPLRI